MEERRETVRAGKSGTGSVCPSVGWSDRLSVHGFDCN